MSSERRRVHKVETVLQLDLAVPMASMGNEVAVRSSERPKASAYFRLRKAESGRGSLIRRGGRFNLTEKAQRVGCSKQHEGVKLPDNRKPNPETQTSCCQVQAIARMAEIIWVGVFVHRDELSLDGPVGRVSPWPVSCCFRVKPAQEAEVKTRHPWVTNHEKIHLGLHALAWPRVGRHSPARGSQRAAGKMPQGASRRSPWYAHRPGDAGSATFSRPEGC